MSHVLWAQGSTRSSLGYRVRHGPDVSVHYNTIAAGPGPRTFSLSQDKETLQTLNGKLQVYLNQVQSLELTNQRLEQQIREELDRKYPRHLRGRGHELMGPDHDLSTVSHLQNQICHCLSVQSELKLKLLGAELTVADVKDRLSREHEHRRRLEVELMDLKAFWEELRNHDLPELQGRFNAQTQQLTELKTQHDQDLQGLLVEGSGGVAVKMQDVQTSDLNQHLNHQRDVSKFNVQVSMMDSPEEPFRIPGMSEVAELMELKKSLANLETELNQLQAVNVMMEDAVLQKSQKSVLQLGVLHQRADVLCSDLDSVLQAAAQKAKDHEALLDVKNHLEAEIQDYKRLLDGLNIQRVLNSNPTSFHNPFIPARRNMPVRVEREKVELAAVKSVSRGHTSLSRPQHLETVTRCQPVKNLHGSPTVKEVISPSTKSQNVAGRQDNKRLELQQERPESEQVVSLSLVDSVETDRDGDESPTAVFDRIRSDVCISVVSQDSISVDEKDQLSRLDQRLLLSDVSLSKKVTKNGDSGLGSGSGRAEKLRSVTKTGVSESSVTHTPRIELGPPSVEGTDTETMVLALGSEDSQVSNEVYEKEKKGQEKMEEEEKGGLDGIPRGVRLDLSSLSDGSMIKQVTESGTSSDLQTNTRTGVSGSTDTRDLLDPQLEKCVSQTMKPEPKEAVAEKDKTVKEKKVEKDDIEGATLRSDQSLSISSDIKQSKVAELGSQTTTSPTYMSIKTLNKVQMTDGFCGNKEVEQVSVEGPSSCGRDIRGALKGQLIGTKDKVTEETDLGSGRPADHQTNIPTSISGTRDLLIGVAILPETPRMDEKMKRQENKNGDKQVVVGVRSQDGGTGSGTPAEQETSTHLHVDIGLQEGGAPAVVQVMTGTPTVIESLSNEVSEKDARIQQGKKGEEKWVVVGGSSDDAGSGSGRPKELQNITKTEVRESSVAHTLRKDLRPSFVEGKEAETEVLALGSEGSQVSNEVYEKEKKGQEKMEEEEKVGLDGIPRGVRLDLSSLSDGSMIKQVTESGTSADLQTNTRTGVSGSTDTRDLLDPQLEKCVSQTMKPEPKEAVAEKDKNVKEKKVEKDDIEGPTLRSDQSLSISSDIKQSKVAELGSQTTTSPTYMSTKTLNKVQMSDGFCGNKEVEQVSVEGPSSCGRDIRGALKGQLIGTKDKVTEETDLGSGRPAGHQTNIATSISGTRDLLIGAVILPETPRMDEKKKRQENKNGDKQVVVGVRSQDGGTGSGTPAEQETSTHLHLDIGLQECGAPAVVQVMTETPTVIESLSNEVSEKDARIQQGKKGEEKWVVVGGSSDDADSGSGRPKELQNITKTGVSESSVAHMLRKELRPSSVEGKEAETEVLAIGSEGSQASNEVYEKEKKGQEKMEEEEKVGLDGIPRGVRLDLSSLSDGSMIKQVTESGTSADLQTNTRTGVSGSTDTRDLLDAQLEKCVSQTMKPEPKEAVVEKDKNVKEKKVEKDDIEGPTLRSDQSLSISSDIKQSNVAESGSQSQSTNATTKILNKRKVHEGIPDNGFHNINDLKTCPSEVVTEVEAQTGQDAKKPLSLTDSGVVSMSSSGPEPDVDSVLRTKEVEIDLNTVEFLMDEVFCPVDLKDHLELLIDPSVSERFLLQHDSEMCPNNEDDDDEFCLTEANVNVRPVEKYILSNKESHLLCFSGGGVLPDEDRNVAVSVEVRNTFGSFQENEKDSEFVEGIITDKEDQLGFGSDRDSGNACGFADIVLGPGVIEEVKGNNGNGDTTAGFGGKVAKPSGRVSGNMESFSQTNIGRRDGHLVNTVPSVQTVRVGGRVGGEQMFNGGQPARMSSGAGRSSVNIAESRESPLVAKQLPTSPQGATRFGRRGSGDWMVHGGPAGGGSNHASTALPVIGSKSGSIHLPTSPLEKGRIGRRDSGEWVLYDRNRLQSAESEGSLPVVTQLPTSPPGPGRFSRKGSGEHVLYGGSLMRRNSFDGTWVEGGPSLVTNPPEPWFGRRGSGEGTVCGGLQRTRSSEIEQFRQWDSGDWVVYGRSEERTPMIRQRATSSSGVPRAGRFSYEEDREQKIYDADPRGVVRRGGSVGSGGKLTKSSSIGGLTSNRRSSVGSGGRPGGGAIISSNRALSPGGRMSFSGGSGGWLSTSTVAVKRISRAGSSDRLSAGRVRSSSVSGGGGGRVITSSCRSTGSATGSRSNTNRISVCKMAAMFMSEARKERSDDQQRRHQREAAMDGTSAAVQRWLTSGDPCAEADRPDGIA